MIDAVEKKAIVIPRWAGVLFFVFATFFFLFLTFPFVVLKESVTSMINRQSEFQIRIGELGVDLPVGLMAKNVSLSKKNGKKSVLLKEVQVEVGLLSLLMGRLRVDTTIRDQGAAYLQATTSLALFPLLTGQAKLRSLAIDAKNYPVGQFFDFGLSSIQFSPEYQQFLGAYLEKLSFQGLLNSSGSLALDLDSPQDSEGKIDMQFVNASFALDDPSLRVNAQVFSKFQIGIDAKKGILKIADTSQIVSNELEIGAKGSLALKPIFMDSLLDLDLSYRVSGSIMDLIGVFLPNGGQGNVIKKGTLKELATPAPPTGF